MEWLRWILLAIGIVLIGAIYLSGRGVLRRRERAQRSGLDSTDDVADEWVGKPRVRRSAEDPAPSVDEPDDAPSVSRPSKAGRLGSEDDTPSDFLTHGDFDFTLSREPVGAPPADDDIGPAGPGSRDAAHADPEHAEPDPEPEHAEPEREPAPEPRPEPPPEPTPEPRSEPGAERDRGPSPAREASAGTERDDGARHAAADGEAEPEEGPEHMIVLYLAAPEGERLVGAQLAAAFARYGLEHGELGIFHARAGGDGSAERPEPATDFSIANAVEPGSFDPATIDTLSTPGVVLFMRVPGPPSPVNAFDRMIATARSLGEELGARVLDEKKIPLTRQEEQHLRDQVRQTLWHVRPSNRSRR